MDEEDLDRIAGRLGAAAPFEVDWDTYATQVITRLSRAERQRRRRGWWVVVAGTLAGAAAAWLLAVNMTGITGTRPGMEPPERVVVPSGLDHPKESGTVASTMGSSEESPVLLYVRRPGTPYALRSMPSGEGFLKPFVQCTTSEGGRVSEIRFYGFTPEGSERGGFIIIGEEGRRLPERPTTGL